VEGLVWYYFIHFDIHATPFGYGSMMMMNVKLFAHTMQVYYSLPSIKKFLLFACISIYFVLYISISIEED
jgi:hypothetical protein